MRAGAHMLFGGAMGTGESGVRSSETVFGTFEEMGFGNSGTDGTFWLCSVQSNSRNDPPVHGFRPLLLLVWIDPVRFR